MLLAGGLLNNGFTEHGTVGRGGDGIIVLYSASHTTNENKVHMRPGERYF